MKLSRVSLGMILIVCVSLVLVCLYRKPQTGRANLTVRFVAFTNDLTGTKWAIFTLSNTGDCYIEVGLPAEIELRNTKRNNPGGYVFPTLLPPSNQPLTVKVVAPRTQEQWRAVFTYYPVNLRDRFNRLVAPSLNRFAASSGIQMRVRAVVGSTAYSEWMAPTVQMGWMGFAWMEF